MRNIKAILIFFVLMVFIALAAWFHWHYGEPASTGMFIVTAMTALGTCGVTILTVFPYVPRDRLEAALCLRKNKMHLKIYNKGNHTVYLGSDKYHTAEYSDCYALWWSDKNNCTEKNSKPIYCLPGDNMAVPPHTTIGYPISPKVFGKKDLNKIKIEVLTSSGFRIEAKIEIAKPDNANKQK